MRSGGYCRADGDAMGTAPPVSVIIPTRDRTTLAARAVRSAVRQTYVHLEIVVVDDGSVSPVVLPPELAKDPRVRTVRLNTSVGAGEARNAGVRASRGALLAFLDDDDEWRPQKIERQVQALAHCDQRTAAVETGYELWDGHRLVQRYLPRRDRDLRRALLEQPYLQPSTVLLRRSAFEELGGFDPLLARVEDWELWVRFADSYEAAALPEVHVDRRASEAAADQLLVWYREMVRRLEPRIEALPPPERSRVRAVHLLAESHLLAQIGSAKAARARAVLALRERPSGWRRPALYVVRSVIGERAWSAGKVALRMTTHPVLRALGRDPFLR
jgi:glycosyltransferase involved in cell wall biosynthesis